MYSKKDSLMYGGGSLTCKRARVTLPCTPSPVLVLGGCHQAWLGWGGTQRYIFAHHWNKAVSRQEAEKHRQVSRERVIPLQQ